MDLSNESVIHIKKSGVEFLQFRRLLEYSDILTHCFTLKPLDFSHEIAKEQMDNNYKLICDEIGVDYKNIVRPKQSHTDVIKEVNDEKGIYIDVLKDVDGLITNKKGEALSLTFADCTPIYLFDPVKKAIGNIHSGWKGTVQRIGAKAVDKMVEAYGCEPKNIICVIGPTIRKCHFEVEDDVKDIFQNEFGYIENIIYNANNVGGDVLGAPHIKKYLIDTVQINKTILMEKGLRKENIVDSGICTVCNSNVVHSYRGDNLGPGRNTAIIMLK